MEIIDDFNEEVKALDCGGGIHIRVGCNSERLLCKKKYFFRKV